MKGRSGNKGTLRLGKGCLCLRLKELGNNNQDLSLGNHHSNIKTQVGEKCSPGGLPASPPCIAQPQPGESRAWWEGKVGLNGERRSSSSHHEPCLVAEILETKVGPLMARPVVLTPIPSEDAGCSLGHCCSSPPSFWMPGNGWVQAVNGNKETPYLLCWLKPQVTSVGGSFVTAD